MGYPLKISCMLGCLALMIISRGQIAPPESFGIPIVSPQARSLDGAPTPEQLNLKQFVEQAGPKEINQLISKLKPRSGKLTLDNVMRDMLQAFDRRYRDTNPHNSKRGIERGTSGETTYVYPDETASARVASCTEENGIIWQGNPLRGRKSSNNRFSSRYRSTNSTSNTDYPDYQHDVHGNTGGNETSTSDDQVPPHMPFSHVTDPNLSNHRLNAWEIETYKNFTHIDQAEDLMADEDHRTETRVAPPPSPSSSSSPQESASANNKGDTASLPNLWPVRSNGSKSKRVRVKGIPHIVISLEDTSDPDHQGYDPRYTYQLEDESSELRGIQRPREPLRHSSTENIVYVHDSAPDYQLEQHPHPQPHQRHHPHPSRRPGGKRAYQFRPSAADIASDVFVDPEHYFFTSTLRSIEPQYGQRETTGAAGGGPSESQDFSSETRPKRRHKKLKKMKPEEIDEIAQAASSNRFSKRASQPGGEEEPQVPSQNQGQYHHQTGSGIQYSPVYSKNAVQGSVNHERARQYGATGAGNGNAGQRLKSDRIMYPTGAASQQTMMTGEDYYGQQGQGQVPTQGQGQQGQQFYNYDASGLPPLHDGGIGNYYSLHYDPHLSQAPTLHHPQAGLGGVGGVGGGGAEHYYGQNKHTLSGQGHHELTSTEYLGGHVGRLQNALSALNIFGGQQPNAGASPTDHLKKLQPSKQDQVIAPGHVDDFYHPYAASDHQVNQFYEDSYYSGWSNTWFILAALIAFTAVFALLLPTMLNSQRHGKKDVRLDLEDEDMLNSSTYQGSGGGGSSAGGGSSGGGPGNNNYHYDNTQNDVGQNSDVWTEIKGVYIDLVNMFRGEYSLLNKLRREPQGPKIVYREDEMDAFTDESEEEDEEEDDERERLTLRNRKRQREFLKKQKMAANKLIKKPSQPLPSPTQKPMVTHTSSPPPGSQGQGKGMTGEGSHTLVSKSSGNSRYPQGKTMNASSVNNLVVVSNPPSEPFSGREGDGPPTPRSVPSFILPEASTLATIPFLNLTGYGGVSGLSNSFLSEWAQVQLINNH